VRVKICGITNPEDAAICEDAGADALGFVHVRGRSRSIQLSEIKEMCASLGPMATSVLVCSPSTVFEAADMFDQSGVDVLQLHSLEPNQVARLRDQGIAVIRAVKPSRKDAMRYSNHVHALLFEHGRPGTGTTYDYSRVPVDCHPRSIIAGGLTMANLDLAIAVKPYAVDVSSGVERTKGRKDPELVSEFIRRCKSGR
jgi:phosphoribosylanthranilate isomerase